MLSKCSDLIQKIQTNSIFISDFNFLCYDIEPRVNKEIIVIYWKICWLFSQQCDLIPMLKISKRNARKKVTNEKVHQYEEKSKIHPHQRYGLLNTSS